MRVHDYRRSPFAPYICIFNPRDAEQVKRIALTREGNPAPDWHLPRDHAYLTDDPRLLAAFIAKELRRLPDDDAPQVGHSTVRHTKARVRTKKPRR